MGTIHHYWKLNIIPIKNGNKYSLLTIKHKQYKNGNNSSLLEAKHNPY